MEKHLKILSAHNLEFEEEQIRINNELSREILRINENLETVKDTIKNKVKLIDRKKDITSMIGATRNSVERAINVVKGALNNQVGTILGHPEKSGKGSEND